MHMLAESKTLNVTIDGVPRTLTTFPEMSGESFQHPDDSDASAALQAVPLVPQLYKMVLGGYYDQMLRMRQLTYNIRLGPDQGADLYAKFVLAARVLDMQELPELYLDSSPEINAYASGLNHHAVTLNHGIISMLNEGELLAIIGHELGHIKCSHSLNRSVASLFASAGATQISSMFPVVGPAASIAAQAALAHWSRMAEFSCDRAALLVVQDPEVAARALAKLAGFHNGLIPDFNFEALLRQIEDYEQYDLDSVQSAIKMQKLLMNSMMSHPCHVLRVKRILDWGKSDHYQDILSGQYVREKSAKPPPFPKAQSLKCSHCGKFTEISASFCPHCGKPLTS